MKKTVTQLFGLFLTFSVSAVSAQSLLNEDFNSTSGVAIPAGWNQVTAATDGGFKSGTPTGLSSSSWPIPAANGRILASNDDGCNCDKSNDFMTMPSLDLSSASAAYFAFKAFYVDGAYQGAQEVATVEVSTDGGSSWTVVEQLEGAGGWQSITLDVSAYAGQSDVTFGFRYNDGGGWTFGLAVEDVNIYIPAALDVALTSNNMAEYVVQGSVPVVGTVFNGGTQAITSLTVSYTVDGGAPVSGTLNGINIAPLTSYDFTHPTNWNASAAGTYQVAITVSNPNGGTDATPNDNSASATVNVATQAVTSLPLVEEFSSNTCPPCASFNATFIPRLIAMNTNMAGGSLAAVKYQMDYPSPGTDKSFNADGDARHTYYGVPGIPDAFLNGVNFGGSQADLDAAVAQTAVMDIALDAVYSGNTVTATATVTPYANFPAGYKLFIALVEDVYNDAGTNGETEFHYIMRKMMSTSNGINLAAMTPGTSITETRSYNATFGNVTQNSFNLWGTSFEGNTVVAWVQNLTTGRIFQAAIDASISVGINSPEELVVKMYPNPASDNLFVRADLAGAEGLTMNVFNSLGQQVATKSFSSMGAGYQTFNFSTDGLSDGVYMVQLISGAKSSTRNIIINR